MLIAETIQSTSSRVLRAPASIERFIALAGATVRRLNTPAIRVKMLTGHLTENELHLAEAATAALKWDDQLVLVAKLDQLGQSQLGDCAGTDGEVLNAVRDAVRDGCLQDDQLALAGRAAVRADDRGGKVRADDELASAKLVNLIAAGDTLGEGVGAWLLGAVCAPVAVTTNVSPSAVACSGSKPGTRITSA